jgi:hypothetical protein
MVQWFVVPYGPVIECDEHVNKLSGSIQYRNFLDYPLDKSPWTLFQ